MILNFKTAVKKTRRISASWTTKRKETKYNQPSKLYKKLSNSSARRYQRQGSENDVFDEFIWFLRFSI